MINETTAAWLGLAALVIGALVRLLKTDLLNATLERFGLGPIPKRALPWVAIGLGVASGFVAGMLDGNTWHAALLGAIKGLVSGAGAIAGHELLVESARAGKEVAPPKTPSGPGTGLVLALVLMTSASACGIFTRGAIDRAQDTARIACFIANAALPTDQAIADICRVGPDFLSVIRDVVGAHRAGVRRELERAGVRREECTNVPHDAGAPDAGGWRAWFDAGPPQPWYDAGAAGAAGGSP